MTTDAITFTETESAYLSSQMIGRLATVDPSGAPQNNPVGFQLDEVAHQLIIGGEELGASRKFRNATANTSVAFVVDDLASTDPWTPRGVEIRGVAQTLRDVEPPMEGFSREIIRITPLWVATWGIQPGTELIFEVRRAGETTGSRR